MDWVVRYRIDPPVEVEGNPPSLPDLVLTFEYAGELLAMINHSISVPEGADVIQESMRTLLVFWEWLNYRRGTRVRIGGAHAQPPSIRNATTALAL